MMVEEKVAMFAAVLSELLFFGNFEGGADERCGRHDGVELEVKEEEGARLDLIRRQREIETKM